jgi:hypothetical protein
MFCEVSLGSGPKMLIKLVYKLLDAFNVLWIKEVYIIFKTLSYW